MRRKNIFLFSACIVVLLGIPSAAQAVPSFSRQTGQECSACHVGSFGPQLTPFGRAFKLNGYTMGDIKNRLDELSAMVFGGFEHTKKDVPDPEHFNANNNLTVDEAALFYAGALTSHLGIYWEATYSGTDDAFVADDMLDLRFADNATLGGKDLVYGVTFNNNPTVQDIWQTVPAWGFPYTESGLAPTPDAEPFMEGLGGTVGGLGAYGMWNDLLYAELSGYGTLADNLQQTLGNKDVSTSDHLVGIAPYWRLALQHNFGPHYVSVGTFGMDARRLPGNLHGFGTDNMLDYALDATYQFSSSDGKHSVSLYGSALHERQNLGASAASGGAANSSDTLNSLHANASYYYNNVYGVTLGRFVTTGSTDALLYPDASNNRPDSAGWTLQVDATPFGTEKSFGWPYFNSRFFAQYTAYDKFNGLRKDYDGTGRNAADNNTLFMGVWMAF